MTFKEQSALLSGFGSSIIKGKVLNDNKIINNQINKKKPSCFVPEVNGGEKEDKDETLEKNGFVLIDLENECDEEYSGDDNPDKVLISNFNNSFAEYGQFVDLTSLDRANPQFDKIMKKEN